MQERGLPPGQAVSCLVGFPNTWMWSSAAAGWKCQLPAAVQPAALGSQVLWWRVPASQPFPSSTRDSVWCWSTHQWFSFLPSSRCRLFCGPSTFWNKSPGSLACERGPHQPQCSCPPGGTQSLSWLGNSCDLSPSGGKIIKKMKSRKFEGLIHEKCLLQQIKLITLWLI